MAPSIFSADPRSGEGVHTYRLWFKHVLTTRYDFGAVQASTLWGNALAVHPHQPWFLAVLCRPGGGSLPPDCNVRDSASITPRFLVYVTGRWPRAR